ncbi:MAG: multicopper oxidase domain-containing protein, partial [Chloroflexi bacterium]|nr:multicopper oxidase domain-containing protein [Chloroflexota bacterium]
MKMKNDKMSRRKFLRLGIGSAGVLTLSAAGVLAKSDRVRQLARLAAGTASSRPTESPSTVVVQSNIIRLAATDGHILLPGRDPIYMFGFNDADPYATVNSVTSAHKGKVQQSSPILDVMEGEDVFITLTTLGFQVRPDLDDAHTVHWHGFRNPNTYYDGVPELSVSVPVGRDFPYYFKPLHPGTYMYHCHFEDVEHVQMGMDGIIFVRPLQNINGWPPSGSNPGGPPGLYVYNDNDGSTAYAREFTMLLNEVDERPHDLL